MRYACTIAEVRAAGGLKPLTLGAREIVVVQADDGVFAVDRACPHEGFGLEQGTVEGSSITCLRHGWRFDLATGTCLTAGDDVRSYEVEVRDGAVFVDVDVEASKQELALVGEGVLSALEIGRPSLAARRTARLLALGESPERVGLLLARYGATHADAGLDPETAAVADALEVVDALDDHEATLVLADVAVGLAERLARATPRFGPEPAASMAWIEHGARATLAGLVRAGDADEAEAVTAGMVAARVPLDEIARGLAEGTTTTFRGAWPLVALERAVRLARVLGSDAARAVLPVAAYGCAAAEEKGDREPFASAAARLVGSPAEPDDVIEECGRTLAAFDATWDAEPSGTGSLLGCGLALAHAGAAAWAVDLVGDAARPALLHARALAATRTGPSTALDGGVDVSADAIARAVAAGPANTTRGLSVCLAAARTAIVRGGPQARRGAYRLLVTPKRERFTSRYVDGGTLVVFDERP